MTEEVQGNPEAVDERVDAPSDPVVEPAQLGELLVAARERWNLSAADLARQMRLGLRQVHALEENDFDALPGNTFVRGFIRNYARVVQTEPELFLDAYERSRPQPQQHTVERSSAQIAFQNTSTPKWVWYVVGFVVLLLASPLMIYWALRDDESSLKALPSTSSNKLSAVQPLPNIPLPLPPPQAVIQSVPIAPASATQTTTSMAMNAPDIAPKPSTETGGRANLLMNFSGDAWVEVQDKSGKVIFSQLNSKGQEQTVQGSPPLTLVVGNAGKVRIAYNGKPIDLAPHTKVDVARFKLE
jgi:cytoskeleton protein RodZ